MSLQAVRDSREQLLILSRNDRARLVIAAVSGQVCDRDGQVKPGRTKWTFQGVRVCRPFWEYAHATGHAGVDMAKKCLQVGADGPPERLPWLPAEKSKFNDADTWFLDLYQSLGEPLAEVGPSFFFVMPRAGNPSMMQITCSGPCASPSTMDSMPESGI